MIMKHLLKIIVTACCLCALALTGCKTTEKNYRSAYELAKSKQDETGGVDSTIYAKMRPQGHAMTIMAGADSLKMYTVTIGFTKDLGATTASVKRYNVVVGQFKQVFNAKEMRNRMLQHGYEGAMVVHTREPLYYVVAQSCETPEEAAAVIKRLADDPGIVVRAPFPWILRPSHLAY